MTGDKTFWTKRVKVFKAITLEELEKTLNEFYKDRFVIATQIFPWNSHEARIFDVVVYFKIKPEAE